MSKLRPVPCKSCHAQIYWVETALGKRMPVDAVPVPDGNIIFIDEKAHVLPAGEPVEEGIHRWKSHFATCPQAGKHRRK